MKEYTFYKALSKTIAHINSQENLDKCKPFEEIDKKFTLLAKEYADSYQDLYDIIAPNIHRREYSRGGKNLHLGYYSTSLMDLVVGNCSRGKLYKRAPTSNTYDYEYLFDESGKLICANQYSNARGDNDFHIVSTAFILYERNIVTTFLYELSLHPNEVPHSLVLITRSEYSDGRIIRYEDALCSLVGRKDRCSEINVETYEYSDEQLKKILWSRYTPPKSILITEYSFDDDDDGNPTTYRAEQHWPPLYYPKDDTVYQVNRKHK